MAWDAARPVPWKRLIVPFLVYAGIAIVGFSFFGSSSLPGLAAGVLMGGALYIAIAVVLVKFGWNPPTWGRPAAPAQSSSSDTSSSSSSRSKQADGPRSKPAATSRTNAGNRRAPKRR